MKGKKIIGLVLAFALVFAYSAPISFAEEVKAETKHEQELKEPHEIIEKAKKDLEIARKYLPRFVINRFNSAIKKLEAPAKVVDATGGTRVGFDPNTIYDLDSIVPRIGLLATCITAAVQAGTQLRNRTKKAHQKVGLQIFLSVISAANPFDTVQNINRNTTQLANLVPAIVKNVAEYPILEKTDEATIYALQSLDDLLTKARFLRIDIEAGKERNKELNNLKSLSKENQEKIYGLFANLANKVTFQRINPTLKVGAVDEFMFLILDSIETVYPNYFKGKSDSELVALKASVMNERNYSSFRNAFSDQHEKFKVGEIESLVSEIKQIAVPNVAKEKEKEEKEEKEEETNIIPLEQEEEKKVEEKKVEDRNATIQELFAFDKILHRGRWARQSQLVDGVKRRDFRRLISKYTGLRLKPGVKIAEIEDATKDILAKLK